MQEEIASLCCAVHINANLSFDWSGRCGKMKQSDKQEEVGRVVM